jgi:hypothetical protein
MHSLAGSCACAFSLEIVRTLANGAMTRLAAAWRLLSDPHGQHNNTGGCHREARPFRSHIIILSWHLYVRLHNKNILKLMSFRLAILLKNNFVLR